MLLELHYSFVCGVLVWILELLENHTFTIKLGRSKGWAMRRVRDWIWLWPADGHAVLVYCCQHNRHIPISAQSAEFSCLLFQVNCRQVNPQVTMTLPGQLKLLRPIDWHAKYIDVLLEVGKTENDCRPKEIVLAISLLHDLYFDSLIRKLACPHNHCWSRLLLFYASEIRQGYYCLISVNLFKFRRFNTTYRLLTNLKNQHICWEQHI